MAQNLDADLELSRESRSSTRLHIVVGALILAAVIVAVLVGVLAQGTRTAPPAPNSSASETGSLPQALESMQGKARPPAHTQAKRPAGRP